MGGRTSCARAPPPDYFAERKQDAALWNLFVVVQRGAKKEEFYIDSQETVTAFHAKELMGDIDLSLLPGSVTAGAFQPSVFDPQQTLRRAGLLNGTVFVLPSD